MEIMKLNLTTILSYLTSLLIPLALIGAAFPPRPVRH